MSRHYCIQNVKVGTQIRVYKISNESVTHFSLFISLKVMRNLRKSQPQFRERFRKLRLRQTDGFLIKKRVCNVAERRIMLQRRESERLSSVTADTILS